MMVMLMGTDFSVRFFRSVVIEHEELSIPTHENIRILSISIQRGSQFVLAAPIPH